MYEILRNTNNVATVATFCKSIHTNYLSKLTWNNYSGYLLDVCILPLHYPINTTNLLTIPPLLHISRTHFTFVEGVRLIGSA